MVHRRDRLTVAWGLLALALSFGFEAFADSHANEREALQRVRASHLAATGRCEEAIAVASELASRDAQTELMVGKCGVQAQQYGRALEALDRARELDANLAGVELYRGISLYHLEDYDASRAALSDVRVVGDEVALLEFYQGLLFLRADQPRESALAFERAAARSPELVEPAASYYAALAWQSLNENEPLEGAVDRVRSEDPEGPWADEADKLVELQAERHRGGQTGLQRWLSLKIGQEYDDNVNMRGSSDVLLSTFDDPESVSREGDWRTVWSAAIGAELFEVEKWTFGAQASYAGNAHDDLDIFDQHYVAGMFWADREIRATTFARLLMTAGAGWIDDDPYLYHLDFSGLIEERWGRWGTTRCEAGTRLIDYRYDIDILEDEYEDRLDYDGVELNAGCSHELPLTVLRSLEPDVYGGYRLSNYFAKGEEWDHLANEVHLGLRLALPLAIDLDARGTYTRRDYREASYFAQPAVTGSDREDNSLQADVTLAKDLTDFLELEVRYEYLDNGSNVEQIDHKRHLAGIYLELEFR